MANAKGDAKNGKLFHVETPRWRRPAGGSEGISIAPTLDTAADVIILALPLSCESLPGRKLLRIPAVPTTATITVCRWYRSPALDSDQKRRALLYSSSHGLRPSVAELDELTRIVPSDATNRSQSTAMRSRSIQCSARPIVTTWNLPTSPGIASALLSIRVMAFEARAAAFLAATSMAGSGSTPTMRPT